LYKVILLNNYWMIMFMKKMVFCIIPLIMVLMGCASSGTTVTETNSNADGTGAAAKLAADINAAKPGSTITLSGWAGLNTALTVPEGVTLDLTEEGAALELQDGAVLTVNGTVNAVGHGDHGSGWVDGGLRVGDGAAVIAGTGTINLMSKGRLLSIGSDKGKRQLTLDGVTLVGLPDNDSPLVEANNGGAFILKSGTITGNTHVGDDWVSGGGVAVYRGTFTMEGGEISGNTVIGGKGGAGHGGGLVVEGTFTMSGGTITGNSALGGPEDSNGGGGGVNVERGTFTMTGGTISGNSASGTRGADGGGVRVHVGTFIIQDGAITGNTATGIGSNSNGGGVCTTGPAGSTFTMSGGTISGNTATAGQYGTGGGVNVDGRNGSTFTMQGGTISGNTVTGRFGATGGGVTVGGDGGVFIMEGGTIYGKAGSLPAGTDASLVNNAPSGAALNVATWGTGGTAKWGIGGTYTKSGAPQSGGSNIGSTSETLIAVPGQ
jgi:hypothetical protein